MLPSYEKSVRAITEAMENYPWDNKHAYAEYLAQTYYYVCHSVRLLAASASRFTQADQQFHKRFLQHTAEENAHELLVLRDLQKLGYKIEDFPENPYTRSMYEIQYYKIEHIDPIALMGYILLLETAAGKVFPWLKEKITGIYGKECAKFIQVHADEDPDHIEKALSVVEKLTPERLELINIALEQSAACCVGMIEMAKASALQRAQKHRAA